MRLTGKTGLLGVIGHPIAHSLSPAMHNAAFAASGQDYVYVPMDVLPERLPDAVRGMVALGFRGFNVTIPHKEEILPLLDELDDSAHIPGAVNTVVVEEDRLRGLNTDGSGFLEAYHEAGGELRGRRVLILGAGGAAAAISAAVLGQGVCELLLINRSAGRARRLYEKLMREYPEANVTLHPLAETANAAKRAEILINATSLGMEDDSLAFPAEAISAEKTVCDVVYRADGETPLVKLAWEQGARVVSGERMLLYQGVESQRVWTGKDPDIGAMSGVLVGEIEVGEGQV